MTMTTLLISKLKQNQGIKRHFIRCLSASSSSSLSSTTDILIVGGGVVGCSLARSINQTIPSLHVTLLEARDAPTSNNDNNNNSDIPHPRSYALSPNSLSVLGDQTIFNVRPGYYESMQIWQANSPASLTFDISDLESGDPSKSPVLGAVIEDEAIVKSLWNQITTSQNDNETTNNNNNNNSNNITCRTNTTLKSLNENDNNNGNNMITATTNQGDSIHAKLVIGADGGNSWVRKQCGFARSGLEYNQQALTFTVELDQTHGKRAFQRFLGPNDGILALLPTFSSNHSIVVWSTSPENVSKYKKDENQVELIQQLNHWFHTGPERIAPLFEQQQQPSSPASTILTNLLYGAEKVLDTVHYGLAMAAHYPQPKFVAPPTITNLKSPKFAFPLSCFHVDQYVNKTKNVALIGDAAHTVHPMAGQGVNIGLNDVQVLVNCLDKAASSGMPINMFLSEYHVNRKRNVTLTLSGIHALHHVFTTQQPLPLQHVQAFSINAIQNLGLLRRQLVNVAANGVAL